MPHVRHRPALARPPAIAAVSAAFDVDVDDGLAQVERTVRAARERGARLVVFPEAALGGYMCEEVVGASVRRSSPAVLEHRDAVFARLARVAGPTVICIGYTEAVPGEREQIFSSAVCISADGVLGHHRKVHIPPGERGIYTAGGAFAAFDTPVGRLGMLICYDKVFPEAARTLALDGAEIIACMAAWPVCRREKAQFGDGSGAAAVLTDAIESTVSEDEFAEESALVDPPLRTREEVAYYRIWRDHLAGVDPEQTLGRFATA